MINIYGWKPALPIGRRPMVRHSDRRTCFTAPLANDLLRSLPSGVSASTNSRRDRRQIVVWGAGAKGVMFLNLLRVSAGAGVDWVVDINPRKQGHFVPLMGQRIVGPDYLLENPPDLVVVMNPEYEREIRGTIESMGIRCEVMSA